MKNKPILLIILLHFETICLGQNIDYPEKGLLKKKTILCIKAPEDIQESIYKYSNGKLVRISVYSNDLLTSYEEIQYNQYGNEKNRISYLANGELVKTEFIEYDSKQRILNRKRLNENNEIEVRYEYDTLSRLVAEYYYRDNTNPDVSCYYFLYDYSKESLIRKSFYMNCSLRSYEIFIYDSFNRKVKTEIYFNGLSKYIVYSYNNTLLTKEIKYDISRDQRRVYDKKYIYNSENQLIKIIEDGNVIEKNNYENGRIVRSEKYDYKSVPRPGGFSGNYVIKYDYFL